LDETDFVSNGLQLAKRFVVIQQLGIERRKVAVAEDFSDLFALQVGSTHNR